MVHVIHHKHSQVSCKYSVLSILPVIYIAHSLMDLQRVFADCKVLFNKAKEEEGKDFYKCLMIYCNTSLTGSLQLPMKILQGRMLDLTCLCEKTAWNTTRSD